MTKLALTTLILFAGIFFNTNEADAQIFNTKLRITVIDKLGNAVPDAEVTLYANEADLESATVDGYRLVAGDNTGVDEFILESVTDGTGTTVLTTTAEIPNGRTDYGLAFHVTREGSGNLEVLTSALPVVNGDGILATADPRCEATTSRGTANNRYPLCQTFS